MNLEGPPKEDALDSSVTDEEEEAVLPKAKRAKTKRRQGDDTESDSDFDNIKQEPRGERKYLEEYLTLGELGGKIPPSLLVNVDFEKFAKENGFEPLELEPQGNGQQQH